ncbi:hypothetical protein DBV10_08165 [Acidovorax sp. FJL06]|nr:hypothetical protein DBV10_08165 [Acidovorax sp. FJL06]
MKGMRLGSLYAPLARLSMHAPGLLLVQGIEKRRTQQKGNNQQDQGQTDSQPDHPSPLPLEMAVDALSLFRGHCLLLGGLGVTHAVLSSWII